METAVSKPDETYGTFLGMMGTGVLCASPALFYLAFVWLTDLIHSGAP